MSGGRAAFDPRTMLALVVFGALAFLATLWLIGAGAMGGSDNNGGTHAAAKGLTGHAALVQLLRAEGHEVALSRSPGGYDSEALLVLTPPQFADAEDVAEIMAERRYQGPTLLILPKWNASPIPDQARVEKEDGWVILSEAMATAWADDLDVLGALEPEVDALPKGAPNWRGLGLSGTLPVPGKVQSVAGDLDPLVTDSHSQVLVGYLEDNGTYPVLDEAAGQPPRQVDENGYDPQGNAVDTDLWNVTVVAEPDLFNNYAMADRTRYELAHAVIDAAMEGEDLPIVFDLTLNGLGATRNLLTLAFAPPFLAATLCLILAGLIVGWRAFRRFGPPLAEARAIAFGKAQLVANSAGFIQRSGRTHLLAEPYAALLRRRVAAALGLRHADDAAIDAALARRMPDAPAFSQQLRTLAEARRPADILRAAHALKTTERTLAR